MCDTLTVDIEVSHALCNTDTYQHRCARHSQCVVASLSLFPNVLTVSIFESFSLSLCFTNFTPNLECVSRREKCERERANEIKR